MNTCFFVSDLHGKMSRYEALLKLIKKEKPDFLFMGGDLLPHRTMRRSRKQEEEVNFVTEYLIPKFNRLKETLECSYPEIFLIPGNDDEKTMFNAFMEGEKTDLWRSIHNQCIVIGKYRIYGYGCVPPTPFMIKDWDRFDISEDAPAGSILPADGYHSTKPDHDPTKATILNDLEALINDDPMEFGVFLFHSPPYQTFLDLAADYNQKPDQFIKGTNVGSKAIRSLIDDRQPFITMHGHIHESARITGYWQQTLGRTITFSAAHDGPELALVKFELNDPLSATRRLIKT